MEFLIENIQEFSAISSVQLPKSTTEVCSIGKPYQPKIAENNFTNSLKSGVHSLKVQLFQIDENVGKLETLTIAAVATVLHRYSGQETILVTSLQNSTTYKILILKFSEDQSFRDLCYQVNEQFTQSSMIIHKSQVQYLLEQTMVLPDSINSLFYYGVGWKLLDTINSNCFDIFVELEHSSTNEINHSINIHFHTNLHSDHQIRQFGIHLSSILENGCSQLDEHVQKLQILSKTERRKILFEFNNMHKHCLYDKDNVASSIDIFSQSVSKWPNAISISQDYGTHKVKRTYAELSQIATQISKLIFSKLQVPSANIKCVAVLLRQGIDNIATNLGILKLQMTVAMIHYEYTATQVENCLTTLGRPTLITTRSKFQSISILYENTIFIDDYWMSIEEALLENSYNNRTENLSISKKKNDCPYVFFTSGSTGTPKAIMLTNKCLRLTVCFTAGRYDTGNQVRSMLVAPTGFILSIFDVWATLSVGGTMCVPPEKARIDSMMLLPWLYENDVTNFTVSTIVAETIVAIHPNKHFYLSKLKWMIFGGEKCQSMILRSESWKFNCSFIYGSTETSVIAAFDMYCGKEYTSPPVGRPVNGVQIFVLDNFLHPVIIGVRGDIYISGDGLMYGYLNDIERTEAALIPNPFGPYPSMYKTGDIGYWSEDGDLVVVGRKDAQIKIHGMRLELGEVENTLLRFPPIKEAVVLTRELETTKHLVAICTLNEIEEVPTQLDIYKFLQQRIQRHAIPLKIIFLDNFPKNPSGKIDRHQLRAQVEKVYTKKAFSISQTAETIRKAWAIVIGIPDSSIDTDSNFFSLGGNSMSAFRLISCLITKFPNVEVQHIFQFPQFGEFSRRIENYEHYSSVPYATDFEAECRINVELNLSQLSSFRQSNFIEKSTKTVLLTSSTGYFGSAFLIDILHLTNFNVVCIVRAQNNVEAQNRVENIISNHPLSKIFTGNTRVTILAGNVSKPLFGLTSGQYNELCGSVDAVYNGAAEVNFVKRYEQLRDSTVAITRNVIKFATQGKLKWIHHMSSVAVFFILEIPDGANVFSASEERLSNKLSQLDDVSTGYCQSKWVTEELIWRSIDAGVPGSIYRIGEVGSHRHFEIVNRQDVLAGFLISCKKTFTFPDIQNSIPFVSLDFATKAILSISQYLMDTNEHTQRVFHIVEKNVKVKELIKHDTKRKYKAVTLAEWEVGFNSVAEFTKVEDVSAYIYLHIIKREKHNETKPVVGCRLHVETQKTDKFLKRIPYWSDEYICDSCKHYVNLLLN